MENYILILERLHGDFIPIDLTLINKLFTKKIENIDHFTSFITENKLRKLIKDLNIVTDEYLKGTFYILDSNKRKHQVIYKDTFKNFSITEFIYLNKDNKNLINTIYNIYPGNKTEFKTAINNDDIAKIIFLLKTLPYIDGRELKFYIKNNLLNN